MHEKAPTRHATPNTVGPTNPNSKPEPLNRPPRVSLAKIREDGYWRVEVEVEGYSRPFVMPVTDPPIEKWVEMIARRAKFRPSLWTTRDLLSLYGMYSKGLEGHLGKALKRLGFKSRKLRGLIDASGKRLPACTLWRMTRGPLPSWLRSDEDWRILYHKQLFAALDIGVEVMDAITKSIVRDMRRADPDDDEIPRDVEQLKENVLAARKRARSASVGQRAC